MKKMLNRIAICSLLFAVTPFAACPNNQDKQAAVEACLKKYPVTPQNLEYYRQVCVQEVQNSR